MAPLKVQQNLFLAHSMPSEGAIHYITLTYDDQLPGFSACFKRVPDAVFQASNGFHPVVADGLCISAAGRNGEAVAGCGVNGDENAAARQVI